ncbi:MAG: hypothetical protein K2H22_00150 [Muribaculaceae bacterium]|nr:hypothetical protein [Muribaculaceae bacterium]
MAPVLSLRANRDGTGRSGDRSPIVLTDAAGTGVTAEGLKNLNTAGMDGRDAYMHCDGTRQRA